MNMKLWDKGISINEQIEKFTVGRDREMDLFLAGPDVMGTIAHCIMLGKVGLLSSNELHTLRIALSEIYREIGEGGFLIEEGIEDVHSQVEYNLTKRLGDIGKKVHSGRSRNDQVLVDLRLFTRDSLITLSQSVKKLFDVLQVQSETYKNVLLPGYTHLQIAMPSSFGLWFGAWAEALTDDMLVLQSAFNINNQNPLGSAAGYGSSFPIDRRLTTQLLGFDDLNYNVVYAQMSRGKVERIIAFALSNLAATLSRMANDLCLYMSQNFNFISLPTELTTGSSIMPHKKNPDIFELIRARCNRIQALPFEITMTMNNLPSGYFRDMQLIKESFLPVFDEMESILELATFMIKNVIVNESILDDPKYNNLFSVEAVNEAVLQGVPFRDAYKMLGQQIADGTFSPSKQLNHTHEGSIGNLCNEDIHRKFEAVYASFAATKFDEVKKALIEYPG
ncbi:MAG: argininosuccinate lyase [Bacteroidales bacterium]|nr:argininosuccinate lyase [Bacteroidales bacterium]